MTLTERRAVVSLSTLMGLRMMGLFMVLPLFSLYARQLPGATPTRIGLAMGIYGLFQAIFQIPLGALSDRLGRKPIIAIGLLLFILGSVLSAMAHSILMLMIGRALQGMGAIGSTLLAFIADLTREEQRTKAMAIAGITIGLSFSIAMVAGPVLSPWLSLSGLFFLAALLGLTAMILLYTWVPSPPPVYWHADTEPELKSFFTVLITPELAKLNSGILILHALFTASFVVIPISLDHFLGLSAHRQWLLYLPTLFLAFTLSLFCMGMAERKHSLKPYFLSSILALAIAEYILWIVPSTLISTAFGLCLFFAGFSLLEAFLPSLVSRTAPKSRKGTALGLYSCSQFLGIFVGGVLGGWLYGQFSFSGVYLFCIILALFWFVLTYRIRAPLKTPLSPPL